MKALLLKEFRETRPVWLAGAALLLIIILADVFVLRADLSRLLLDAEGGFPDINPMTPNTMLYGLACGVLAAVLGWYQVYPEKRQKLWGFLRHRPVTADAIFGAKSLAGLGCYLAVAGLPLLVYAGWAALPGSVPAPFVPAPFVVCGFFVAGGASWYFAGMLAGLRRLRHGAVLSLGAPLLLWVLIRDDLLTWTALGLMTAVIAMLGVAAWGSFAASGFDREQRGSTQAALAVSLAFGWTCLCFLGAVLAADLVERTQTFEPPGHYRVAVDGQVYFEKGGKRFQPGPNGELAPVGEPVRPAGIAAATAVMQRMRPPLERSRFQSQLPGAVRNVRPWEKAENVFWHWDEELGRFLGYDLGTRRFIGSLGPEGFRANSRGAEGFSIVAGSRTLATARALFEVDFSNRSVRKLFETTETDPIVAAGGNLGVDNQGFLLATRSSLRWLHKDGREEWRLPEAKSLEAKLYVLKPEGHYLLWAPGTDGTISVTWLGDGRAIRSVTLPRLSRPPTPLIQEYLVAATGSPVLVVTMPWLAGRNILPPWWGSVVLTSLAGGLVSALAAGVIARKKGTGAWAWITLSLCFGLPGLLTLLLWPGTGVQPRTIERQPDLEIFENPRKAPAAV